MTPAISQKNARLHRKRVQYSKQLRFLLAASRKILREKNNTLKILWKQYFTKTKFAYLQRTCTLEGSKQPILPSKPQSKSVAYRISLFQ